MKTRNLFKIWCFYVALILIGAVVALTKGFKINADFLSVFPKHEERGSFYQANKIYEQNFENEVLVFVEALDNEKVIAAAEDLKKSLQESALFSKIQTEFAGSNEQWTRYLYERRKALLTEPQIERVRTGQLKSFQEKALQNLYSPTGMTSQLGADPLNLFADYFMGFSQGFALKPHQGYLIAETEKGSALFIRAHLQKDVTDFNERLVSLYERTKDSAKSKGIVVAMYGASLFSAFGSVKSMQEVNIYGTLSLLAVTGLLVWSFSSVIPVVASFLTILLSVGAGALAVLLIYSSMHILSLLLGISVLGIVTDYCTHFFAKFYDPQLQNSEQVINKIKTALGIGFITNMLTYLCFYFTDLLVLKQLSIFTMAGIFTTYVTVLAVFPKFKFKPLKADKLLKLKALSSVWKKHSPVWILASLFVIATGALIALGGFKFNDDIKLLQTVDAQLKSDEDFVFGVLGAQRASSYFVVTADSEEQLLQQEEVLAKSLGAASGKAISVSQLVPSLKKQNDSIAAYEALKPTAKLFLMQINAKNPAKAISYFDQKIEPLKVSDLLAKNENLPVAINWIGEVNGKYYSVVNVVGAVSYEALKSLENPQRHLFSKAKDLSFFLSDLRKAISGQFALVLVVLLIVLTFIYKFKKAVMVLLVPGISAYLTLLLAQMITGYLNLFHILAVILIFCLGMDYSVFFSQSKGETQATHIGVFISFLSTITSFAVLGLSQTQAVSSFGLSVFIGITFCYFLSPMVAELSHE